jgi:hypothetical protein
MNEPEPVNLSPLDPARHPERWSAVVEATRLRVEAVLAERTASPDALAVVGGWARPILAGAAVALGLLGATLAAVRESAPPALPASDAQRLAALTVGFADGHVPTGAELAAAVQARGAR